MAFIASLSAASCGGGEGDARVPIAHESPEDEILHIGRGWESGSEEKGFRTPPSPITMFSSQSVSTVTFTPGARAAREVLTVDDTFRLGTGASFHCQTRVESAVTVLFGMRGEEAAVEMRRPAVSARRACTEPGFPEPTLSLPATAARFVLRGDRLVPFAPATEKRVYIPTQ